MTFDRSRYSKGADISKSQKVNAEAEKNQKQYFGSSDRIGFHYVKDGVNVFRVAIAHNPDDSPYLPFMYSQLPIEVPKYENGELVEGQTEIKRKKIFIATQHGPKDKLGRPVLKTDPVEFYLEELVNKINEETDDKEEVNKRLAPVKGYWEGTRFVPGIKPEQKTVCLCWDEKWELGRLELNKKWYQDIEKISLKAGNGDFAADIFSHPDEGFPLVIEKTKVKKGKTTKTEYRISKEDPDFNAKESWEDFFERTRVPDEKLKDLLEKDSLQSLFVDSYNMKTFEWAIEGLERFDEEHGFGLFEDSEFKEKIEALEEEFLAVLGKDEEEETSEEDDSSKTNNSSKKEEKEKVSVPPVPKMKKILKEYMQENYGELYDLPSSKEELTKWYLLAQEGEELPIDEQEEEEQEGTQTDEEVSDEDLDDQIAKLRRGSSK